MRFSPVPHLPKDRERFAFKRMMRSNDTNLSGEVSEVGSVS
jgi:hypothetical protein